MFRVIIVIIIIIIRVLLNLGLLLDRFMDSWVTGLLITLFDGGGL